MRHKNSNKSKTSGKKTYEICRAEFGCAEDVAERIFPCRSNEEVRNVLATTLRPSVHIEVAGGIVRHSW